MYETGPFSYALAKILKLNLLKVNFRFTIEGFQVTFFLFVGGIWDRKHCEIVTTRTWTDRQERNH